MYKGEFRYHDHGIPHSHKHQSKRNEAKPNRFTETETLQYVDVFDLPDTIRTPSSKPRKIVSSYPDHLFNREAEWKPNRFGGSNLWDPRTGFEYTNGTETIWRCNNVGVHCSALAYARTIDGGLMLMYPPNWKHTHLPLVPQDDEQPGTSTQASNDDNDGK